MYRRSLLLIIALAAGTACGHRVKASRVFVPPPVMPEAPQQVPPLPSAPALDSSAPAQTPQVGPSAGIPTVGPPPPVPRRTNPPRAAAPSSIPAPQPATAEPAPSPRLETMLTPDQLREYNRSMDESLDRVKRVLATVAGRRLKPELKTIVSRVETFQKQAEQARESDLVTAVNLARRADLLAQDLVKRLP